MPRDTDAQTALAQILSLAVQEPASLDQAREALFSIEDLAKAALFAPREPGDGDPCPCCGDFIQPAHACV